MKKFLKALPIPAAGVALGLAALGNLLQSYSEGVRLFFGALSAVLWLCLVLKVIFCWKGVCQAIYLVVLCRLPGFLKLPFYPSYAAFTFPMLITAIAAKQAMACLTKMGWAVGWLSPVVLVETVIAAVLVVYTLVRYLMAVVKSCKVPA